jgi:hypothetical protein
MAEHVWLTRMGESHMRLRLLGIAVCAALSVAFSLARAAGSSGAVVPTGYEIDPWDQVVIVFGQWSNPDACGTATYAILPMSNSNYKDTLATILAAGTAGRTITFWFNGCTGSPWGTTAPAVLDTTITF